MASALKKRGMPENLAGRVCRYALNALCSPNARCASTCAVWGAGQASVQEPGVRQARTPPQGGTRGGRCRGAHLQRQARAPEVGRDAVD
jgi:hypothetical protein